MPATPHTPHHYTIHSSPTCVSWWRHNTEHTRNTFTSTTPRVPLLITLADLERLGTHVQPPRWSMQD
ncbi:hypothetical protein E2C01_082291 [Portunus trituberculatus]|uniref:Uncharacterized protein n=1 Tax=Portunus trituberculatus TaxID=210409 RepID=A0A5B7IYP3_PORTR|nr:hypothetical protein [Portunus trituberculatus]